MNRRIISGLIGIAFVIQLIQVGEPLKVQAISRINTPAEFSIPGDIKTSGIEPIGANLTSINRRK